MPSTPDDAVFQTVCPALRAPLRRRGFSELTAVQLAVIGSDSRGRNLRLSSQTGSGKTVAIGLALADELVIEGRLAVRNKRTSPLALIITPTRELASQVRDELAWLYADVPGMDVVVVTGGTDISRERRLLARHPAVVVGTPGRLLDHLRHNAFSCEEVRDVVLDEADRMLEMGFREELDGIIELLPAERRSHLVSATFPPQVRRFANAFQPNPLHLEGTRLGAANADITHVAHLVRRNDRYAALINTLLLAQGDRCLVFVKKRSDAAEIAEMLAGDGFSALPFSGDLPQAQRTRTLNAFRNGTIATLVATDVAARGIDVADIGTVIHIDVSFDSDVYTHRSGRTGRAGQSGRSLIIVPTSAERQVQRVLHLAGVDVSWLPVPSPAKIRRTITKQMRSKLHEMLAADNTPAEKQLEYAAKLLEDHDPKLVVAHLLELAEPVLPREPAQAGAVEARRAGGPDTDDAPRGRGRERRDRDETRSGPRRGDGDYVRFSINWGQQSSATPGRLLAHICRRGDVDSSVIGAMKVEARTSTFDVTRAAATAFEAKASELDERDPKLKIVRAAGPAGDGPPAKRPSAPTSRARRSRS